jgi:putative serine protease PepD
MTVIDNDETKTKGRSMSRLHLIAAVLAAAAAGVIGVGVGALLDSDEQTPNAEAAVSTATTSATSVSTGRSLSVAEVYRRAAPSVVEITVNATGSDSTPFDGGTVQSQGSGFVYDAQGHIVTNAHVVDGAQTLRIRFSDGSSYSAEVVGTDASTDLAVLKVDAPSAKLQALSLADSSQLAVGDGVVAIGSPFGLEGTVTSGIVSALHREIVAPNDFTIDDAIQTDAALNHGNSGGPLLDLQGRVVGVASQIRSDSGGNEGVGFAVPSDTVRRVADALIADGRVEHAYLGVSLAGEGSARISAVREATPAAEAGLRAGDVILSIGGTEVSSASEVRSQIDSRKPGDDVRVTVRRDGREVRVTVTLANRPA